MYFLSENEANIGSLEKMCYFEAVYIFFYFNIMFSSVKEVGISLFYCSKEKPIKVSSEICVYFCMFVNLFALITLEFIYIFFSTMEPDKLFVVSSGFSERKNNRYISHVCKLILGF